MSPISTSPPFIFHRGWRPLLISIPHVGTHVPPVIATRLTPQALELHDTDWHLDRLYSFAQAVGASVLQATHSRYVVDLNRPPDGATLYPGQNFTGLCPVDGFDNTPLYLEGLAPDAEETEQRLDAFWRPYHAQLAAELTRIKAQHGVAMLWDAHSIRSELPRFFEGKLPDFNLGTADGASCDPALAQQLLAIAHSAPVFTAVLNGRFKGGHITRHYGQPAQQVHAVQLEMTQLAYMQEAMPFEYLPQRAEQVLPILQRMLRAVLAYAERT